jgi:hypothetical protein
MQSIVKHCLVLSSQLELFLTTHQTDEDAKVNNRRVQHKTGQCPVSQEAKQLPVVEMINRPARVSGGAKSPVMVGGTLFPWLI